MRNLFIIILFLANNLLFAQVAGSKQYIDFESIVSKPMNDIHLHNYNSYYKDCSNEIQVVITSFFIGYKNFISSQDVRSCTFSPSCSVYAIETIKKHGIIVGFMDAIDRLTRCNGLSPENYEIDVTQKLLIDNP